MGHHLHYIIYCRFRRKEGSFLKLHRLTATFGRLNNQTLELGPGLNILEAPNESGKSTWCAFLLAMLYGIDSRQRDKAGFIAEKNRYIPWAGSAMTGRLDCSAGDTQMTLLRQTRRPAAPMGEFTALYTGTAREIPGLTGQNCGEELLGVSRDVYERSAFIRQAGLGISSNAELERRIAALISSGEEETSFTEAYAALKKQLNRRRHNRTGELPAAEEELHAARHQLEQIAQLRSQLQTARSARDKLQLQQEFCQQQLSARLIADAAVHDERNHARAAAEDACRRADELLRALEDEYIPDIETIGRLRGAIVNLETTRKSLVKARRLRDDAAEALLQAEAAVNESPFVGLTPEQAKKLPLDLPLKPRFPWWAAALITLAGAVFGYFIFSSTQEILPAVGGGCGLFGFVSLITSLSIRRKQNRWQAEAETLRAERDRELDLFSSLWTALTEARAEADKHTAAADALHAALSSNEQGILLEVRRFAPAAFDIVAADAALRECAARRKAVTEAQITAEAACLRLEILEKQSANAAPPPAAVPDIPTPSRSADELRAELADIQARLAAETSAVDRLSGQLNAIGDPAETAAQIGELEKHICTLSKEYEALTLALVALEDANAELQARFSPALSRRATEIFRKLTSGRYDSVVLDRTFHMAAEPSGDPIYRNAQFLSAGAVDQLYLAVRLAICEMVLPAETCPPIILDDALTNCDDQRCAAALRLLRRESEHRQILLFTCHSREAEFFRSDPAVRIQRLTDSTSWV